MWAQTQPANTEPIGSVNSGSMAAPQQPDSAYLAGRKWLVGGASVIGMAGSLYVFTKISDYQYSKVFHTVDDSKGWRQLDKNEHAFIAYTASRWLTEAWEWAGVSRQQAVGLSSATSLVYLSTKEFLDGHKADWGWSWTDMGADVSGIVLFAAQELAWQEQKVQFKFSASPRTYEPAINNQANYLFGYTKAERALKDHNAQTYWLSFNLKSIANAPKIPAWLNVAVGYGAENMYGTFENIGYQHGTVVFDRTDLKRYRQWYLAPDIDLTKIKTRSKAIKTVLFALNTLKFPLPALELANGKLKGHFLHF